MEKQIALLYQSLHKLTGLHRQLLETVRTERENLVQADIPAIQNITGIKQALLEDIYRAETNRVKIIAELALHWKRPVRELTLPQIIIEIQVTDPKGSDQLRSIYNALTVLIQRITEQNQDNRVLLEKSLEHIHQMKRNILEESGAKSNTYAQNGQRISNCSTSRIFSKEA